MGKVKAEKEKRDKIIDRRRSPRINDSMAIQISLDHLQGPSLKEETHSINISSGGLCFISKMDLRAGDRVRVKIIPLHRSLMDPTMILSSSVIILRSHKRSDRSHEYLVAGRFQSVPQWEEI